MKRSEFNTRFREHVRHHISPTPEERSLVSAIYEALQKALGAANCLQIGSYARFTSITPLHDLDVLYVMGKWPGNSPDPSSTLRQLKRTLEADFKNPTIYAVKISEQSHSITLSFLKGQSEVLGVDVVPAYAIGRNEFGADTYMVPEIANRGHARRRQRYEELSRTKEQMGWIKSDPRGYIEVAKRLNTANEDYRHAVKFVKGWKHSCKNDLACALKSFHVEQAVASYFVEDNAIDMFGAVFGFFCDLPHWIERPRFRTVPTRASTSTTT